MEKKLLFLGILFLNSGYVYAMNVPNQEEINQQLSDEDIDGCSACHSDEQTILKKNISLVTLPCNSKHKMCSDCFLASEEKKCPLCKEVYAQENFALSSQTETNLRDVLLKDKDRSKRQFFWMRRAALSCLGMYVSSYYLDSETYTSRSIYWVSCGSVLMLGRHPS